MKNLLSMRMDGEVSKDEYLAMRNDLEEEKMQAERELIALESRAEKTTEKPDIKTVRSLLLEKMDFRKHKLDRDILDKFVLRVVPETERVFQWYLNFNMADNRIETKQLVSEMHLTYKEAYDYRHEVKGAMLRVSQWKDLEETY